MRFRDRTFLGTNAAGWIVLALTVYGAIYAPGKTMELWALYLGLQGLAWVGLKWITRWRHEGRRP